MKRYFAVVSAVVLGLFFLMVIAATQIATAHQPPIDQTIHPSSLPSVPHTRPITSGAPADIALIVGQNESQAYDFASLPAPYNTECNQTYVNDIYGCVNGGTLRDGTTVAGCNNEPVNDPNFPELTRGICQPFRKSKEAAYRLIQQLRPGVDRIALAAFAESSQHYLSMTFNLSEAIAALNNMDVYVNYPYYPNPTGHIACSSSTSNSDVWKCATTNVGGGLVQAQAEFSPARPGAQQVVIVTAAGATNRANYDPRLTWSDPTYGTCPLSERNTTNKCRDAYANTRHYLTPTLDSLYDADDFARDSGDLLGLDPILYPSLGSAGIRVFTIGIGKSMVCSNGTYTPPNGDQPAICTGSNPVYGDPDSGEQLLKYLADVGYEGDLAIGPCLGPKSTLTDTWGIPLNPLDFSGRNSQLGLSCGNYYFAPDATSLSTITLDIAARIFTNNELLPDFSAAPLSGAAPLSVTFSDLSIGPYTSTLWTFGDSHTSTAISPTHVYTDPGVYTVTLTIANITTTAGLTRTNYITVYQPVSAAFSAIPLSGTAPLTVTFTNQSTGDYSNLLWDFGDGITSTLFNPIHTYNSAGHYTVTLQASGLGGADWITQPNVITVYQPVQADFSAAPLSGTAPLTVTFTNQSSGDYADLLWDFGDGITSTANNPTHAYAAGVYTVSLSITGLGGTDIVTHTNYIDVSAPRWHIYLPLIQQSP